LLLLLLLLLSYADSRSIISSLPGFPGPLPFYLETGYVGVGEFNEDQLFYYFVESENNPKEDPLVLWLTGGPGCSSWSGFAFEIGPLYYENVDYNGSVPTLGLRQHSWTKVASIIFLDSPVGTGFSYSSGSKDGNNGDIRSSKEVHEFLKKWLIDHPQFLSNSLYISGDSYSGITIPIIVQEISNGIETGQEPILNLKGYLLGNPGTDPKLPQEYRFHAVKKSCKGDDYTNPTNPQCKEDLQAVNKCEFGLNREQILEPICFCAFPMPEEMDKQRRSMEEDSRHAKARNARNPVTNYNSSLKRRWWSRRNDKGDVIFAFSIGYGHDTNTCAELRAIHDGLSFCLRRGFSKVMVESNLHMVVNTLNGVTRLGWKWRFWLNRIEVLMRTGQTRVGHIFREANYPADALARLDSDSQSFILFSAPTELPSSIRWLIFLDKVGRSAIWDS
ncbi:serine carboxypeptidase-like 18, partial [Magnolia sinica]|uniref:serine carboxypeptidase-like 18 n=1 Tax=Magnolia sinica TaxID=86752 RepID=UPI00265A7B1D